MAILKPCEIDFSNSPVKAEMLISIKGRKGKAQGNGTHGRCAYCFLKAKALHLRRVVRTDTVRFGREGTHRKELYQVHAGEGDHSERPFQCGLFHYRTHLKSKAMFIENRDFEAWMKRMMERFDRLEKRMEKPGKQQKTVGGEKLLDNQYLCFMLNCSNPATLPRGGPASLQAVQPENVLP